MDLKPHNLALEGNSIGDNFSRRLHKWIPLSFQRAFRDSGSFRSIADASVLVSALMMPHFGYRFIALGSRQRSFQYGSTDRHMIHVIDHDEGDEGDTGNDDNVLVFVHGGAWGSGKPWMYRLSAHGIGTHIKASKIILLQYPVYPCANILEQRDALCEAMRYIRGPGWSKIKPENNKRCSIFLCGHSSGANICALALLYSAAKGLAIADAFISLSGVFDIQKHYFWEMRRGVHLISPMGGAAISLSRFWESSPTTLLQMLERDSTLSRYFPITLVLHGTDDTTVPISSSIDFASELSRHYVDVHTSFPVEGHVQPIIDMMYHDHPSPCSSALHFWFRSLEVGKGDNFLKKRKGCYCSTKSKL